MGYLLTLNNYDATSYYTEKIQISFFIDECSIKI